MKKAVIPAVIAAETKLAPPPRVNSITPERLPVDTRTLRAAAKYLEPKRLKPALLAVAGGAALLSALSSLSHARLYRAAVARELKKQLAPVNEQLKELQRQNAELKEQNEALRKQLS